MFKFFKYILIISVYVIPNIALSFNSSSYLIANTAINLFDFEKAYPHFLNKELILTESDLHNQLITVVNLNLKSEANTIAEKILKINILNQEAWIARLAYAKTNNNLEIFKQYKKEINNSPMEVLDYIFFDTKGKIKEKNIISKSILEIVQAAISKDSKKINYKFILFYLSIANILDPNFNEAYYYQAQVYQYLKNYSKAEFFYKKISPLHNLYIESQKYIAINKSKRGLFIDGEKELINLTKIYKDNMDLLISLADLYRVEKKYEKALHYYSKIIELENLVFDDYWQIYYFRGICLERLKKWELAEKDFLYSLELNSNSPQVLNYLAYGWLERNYNIEKAVQMLQKAHLANPDSYYILDSLAWGFYKMAKFEKAKELMEKVILMAPGEAVSLDHLADIYLVLNRKREAIFFWKQALDLLDPEDMIKKSLIKKLEVNDAS